VGEHTQSVRVRKVSINDPDFVLYLIVLTLKRKKASIMKSVQSQNALLKRTNFCLRNTNVVPFLWGSLKSPLTYDSGGHFASNEQKEQRETPELARSSLAATLR